MMLLMVPFSKWTVLKDDVMAHGCLVHTAASGICNTLLADKEVYLAKTKNEDFYTEPAALANESWHILTASTGQAHVKHTERLIHPAIYCALKTMTGKQETKRESLSPLSSCHLILRRG